MQSFTLNILYTADIRRLCVSLALLHARTNLYTVSRSCTPHRVRLAFTTNYNTTARWNKVFSCWVIYPNRETPIESCNKFWHHRQIALGKKLNCVCRRRLSQNTTDTEIFLFSFVFFFLVKICGRLRVFRCLFSLIFVWFFWFVAHEKGVKWTVYLVKLYYNMRLCELCDCEKYFFSFLFVQYVLALTQTGAHIQRDGRCCLKCIQIRNIHYVNCASSAIVRDGERARENWI